MKRDKPIVVQIENRTGYVPSWLGFVILGLMVLGFFWLVYASADKPPEPRRPAVQNN